MHCHWIASDEITAEVDLLQAIQLCIKRSNLQFTNVNVTEDARQKYIIHKIKAVPLQ